MQHRNVVGATTSANDQDTARMFDFQRRWSHLGGGSAADIHGEFGLSAMTYFGRLKDVLESDPPDTVARSEVALLLRVCRRRLWLEE